MFEVVYRTNTASPTVILAMIRLRNKENTQYSDRNADKKMIELLYKDELVWLSENINGTYKWDYINTFAFELEEDAMAFKLRWG